MNDFTKYFLGLLGTTVLSYQSPLQADPISPQLPANDTFLGKLGTTTRATRDGLIYSDSYVKFSTSAQQVNEGDGFAKVTVERSCSDKPLPAALLSYQIANNSSYDEAKQGVDYGETYGTLRWEANECGVKELRVPIIDDREPEFDESFRVIAIDAQGTMLPTTISSGEYYRSDDYTVVTIVDNDADLAPKTNVLSFDQPSYQLTENNDFYKIIVSREQCKPHSPAVSVDVVVTPEIQTDYEISPSWSPEVAARDNIVTLRWGEVHSKNDCDSKYFYLASKQDNLLEPTETIELTLENPSNGALLGQNRSVVNILDDDSSTIGFAQTNYEVTSGESIDIILERKNCTENVPTATATFDANSTQFSTVSWQENECGSRIIHSSVGVSNVSNVLGATVEGNKISIRSVGETDGTLIGFSQDDYTVFESSAIATINVKRTGCDGRKDVPAAGINYETSLYPSVDYSASDGGYWNGPQDFEFQSGTLYWEANECGLKSFDVPIFQDSLYEKNEMVGLSLKQSTGRAKINPSYSYATLVILDDESSATVTPRTISTVLPLGTSRALLSRLYGGIQVPLTWQVSDESIVKVDAAGNVTALALGEATVTLTDAHSNVVSWQVTVIPKELAILAFQGDSEANVGNYIDLKINTINTIPDHNQQTDLWVGIHLAGTPDDQLLYVTDSSYISSLLSTTPQPFKRGLQQIDNTYSILHFVVTPEMVGEYTLYAMLTKSGKTPFEDAARRSILATQTIKLH